jgi:E3 ubiquitin-protein ligase UBR1/E3 ubiquitin-protein ligase UBR3
MTCVRCLQAKRIAERDSTDDHTVSLHIPLHRTFSAILQKLVLLPWDNAERGFLSGLKDEDDFKFTEDEVLLPNAIYMSWFFGCF